MTDPAPLTLGQKQRLFTSLVAKLIAWAYDNGYELSLGWAYRPPEFAELYAKLKMGIASSLHCQRLAVDLNLFLDGVYQEDSGAYRPLGEYWETLHPGCRWGGRFMSKDGNHFSLEHQGRR